MKDNILPKIKILFSISIMQKWAVGAPCRAIYSADGKVYEAIISKIHQNSGMCTVKFVGNYFIFI